MLEFLNNLWELEPSRNRVVVPARQATQAGGVDSLESILVLLKGKNSVSEKDECFGVISNLFKKINL